MMVFVSIFSRTLSLFLLLVLSVTGAAAQNRLSGATLVLFNSNDSDSEALAKYYASKRGIPQNQVVGFPTPATEEITRADFNALIAEPLRKKMIAKGWWITRQAKGSKATIIDSRIRFVAIMRGFPLKIAPDPTIPPPANSKGIPTAITTRNEASVDGEIAALGLPGFTPASVIENPYFGRFTPILDEAVFPSLLLPSRLDAPTPSMVRAMIDDALMVEKAGLWGWAYIDGRDITSGGYTEGDNWMRHIVEMLRQRGVPTIFDNLPTTFGDNFPITDAAVYFGWYAGDINGPFARPDFRFKPGAVAVHLHSFSANTLHSTTLNWCGPLIAHGAAATLGNVYEPYLSLTAHLDLFQDRLMSGLTLAEAGWMSQRALSWMGVVIGDPLYRPYAAWNQFYDPRNRPPNYWRIFRSITLAAKNNILNAMLPINEAARETGDSMFLEALGAAQFDDAQPALARDSFTQALALAMNPAVRQRLELEIAAASRRISPSPSTGPEATPTPHEVMSDAAMSADQRQADSPLLKPAPTPLPLPDQLPNLPYPDL
jgi:uncharacterized protein (TIGR03790 family)